MIPDKKEWLVKACLDVLENDGDILESDVFCIRSDGAFDETGMVNMPKPLQ